MSDTPNNGIPLVPENVLDPAAGINLAVMHIDAILQLAVLGFASSPPSESTEGDRYIVIAGTGDWEGLDNQVVRYIASGDYWQNYSARYALNLADGEFYVRKNDGEWHALEAGGGGGTDVQIITPDSETEHTAKQGENAGYLIFDTVFDCLVYLPPEMSLGWHLLVKNVGGGNVTLVAETDSELGQADIDGIRLLQNPASPVTIVAEREADSEDPLRYGLIGNDWLPTAVESSSLSSPPGTTPALGAVFIPAGSEATGAWTGWEGLFAIHVGGDSYQSAQPPVGWQVYDADQDDWIRNNGITWVPA